MVYVTLVSRYTVFTAGLLSIDHIMDVYYEVKHRLQVPTLARNNIVSL